MPSGLESGRAKPSRRSRLPGTRGSGGGRLAADGFVERHHPSGVNVRQAAEKRIGQCDRFLPVWPCHSGAGGASRPDRHNAFSGALLNHELFAGQDGASLKIRGPKSTRSTGRIEVGDAGDLRRGRGHRRATPLVGCRTARPAVAPHPQTSASGTTRPTFGIGILQPFLDHRFSCTTFAGGKPLKYVALAWL